MDLSKENRLKDELETATREKESAEDKLTTCLYNLQSKEKDLAANLLQTMKSFQTYFSRVLFKINENIPKLEERVINSSKSKVYGENLENHLRNNSIKMLFSIYKATECPTQEYLFEDPINCI